MYTEILNVLFSHFLLGLAFQINIVHGFLFDIKNLIYFEQILSFQAAQWYSFYLTA